MLELARTVRLAITACTPQDTAGTAVAITELHVKDGGDPRPSDPGGRFKPGLAGAPALGLGAIGEFEVVCRGEPDRTGYLIDITTIDRAVRSVFPPLVRDALRAEALTGTPFDPGELLRSGAIAIRALLPAPLAALTYRASPFRSIGLDWRPTLSSLIPAMPSSTPALTILTETFEFAASHRLHLPELTDAENLATFGKCNNPNGHGHNYRIEVGVAVGDDAPMSFDAIGAIVDAEIMRRFDHKHLNLDCPEFATINPSVENIARVCHGLLVAPIAARGGALHFVRVWETEKTSCRYPA